jgi:hypothetical protein
MWGMIFSAVGGVIKGMLSPALELGKMWMEKKRAESEAKIAIQGRIATGDIDYNIAAQEAGKTSWKDEWLTIWTTGVVTALFFPQTAGYVANGMRVLNEAMPSWFSYCFVGMYVAVFGLKGWKLVKTASGGTVNVGTSEGEE